MRVDNLPSFQRVLDYGILGVGESQAVHLRSTQGHTPYLTAPSVRPETMYF
jgi:hypothetical protein